MTPTAHNIIDATCEYYEITRDDLLSGKRDRIYSHPRQIAMHVCSTVLGKSLPWVGGRFNRDHTTVLSGIRAVIKRADPEEARASHWIMQRARGLSREIPIHDVVKFMPIGTHTFEIQRNTAAQALQ